MRTILVLRLSSGKEPFEDWIRELPVEVRAIIDRYIHRVSRGGGKKNIRALKDGVFEIKIDYGPGWRIYFAVDGQDLILLLGGDKKSQIWDIEMAKAYWRQYAQK